MAVTWNYDGAGNLSATLTGTTPGNTYYLYGPQQFSTVNDVAAGTSLTLTATDVIYGITDEEFSAYVITNDEKTVYGSNVFVYGTASTTGVGFPVTWAYDGASTITASFTASTTDSYSLEGLFYAAGGAVFDEASSSATGPGTVNLTLTTSQPPNSGSSFTVILFDEFGAGFFDWRAISTRMFVGGTADSGTAGSPTTDGTDTGFVSGGGGGDDSTTFTGPVRVGVAFNDTTLAAAPTWTYLNDGSSRVASYQIDRGRQFEFDKTDGGTATVSINDRDGTLDPTNAAGPYYGLIEPLLQIKIELWNPVSLQYHTRFRGWIETFNYVVEPFVHQDLSDNTVGVTRLEIQCVDIFAILTAIEMQPDGSFGDTPPTTPVDVTGNIFFDNEAAGTTGTTGRIPHVLGNAGIPAAFYVVFTLNVNMQESIYSPSENVLQVIQDAADAEFPTVANVYGDRLGRLAVHGRLAKFDPDGVAAGASTGAWLFTRWHVGDGKAVAASPTDTAHIRTLSYDRGLSKVFNSALCTPNGIDNTDTTTVTGADIAGQYYQDAPSIAQFGFRSWSAENLLIGADTGDPLTTAGAGTLTGNNAMDECLAFATYIVTNYKTPRNRIGEITFKSIHPDAEGAAANWDLLCQADISDVLEVTVRGPGDSPTGYIFNAEEFFIEGVHETARPATGEYAMVELSLDTSPKAYFPIGGGGGVGVT